MRVDITGLAKRLTQTASDALERAAGYAKEKGHGEVTVDHVLFQILAVKDEDAELLLAAAGLDRDVVLTATRRRVAGHSGGHAGRPGFAKALWPWIEGAWLLSSVELEQNRLRTGALLWAAARHGNTLDATAAQTLSAMKPSAVRDALAPSAESGELFGLGELEMLGRAAEDAGVAKAREKIVETRAAAAKAAADAEAAKVAEEADAARGAAAARAAWDAAEAKAAAEDAIARAVEAADMAKAAAAAAASPRGRPDESGDDAGE